MNDSWSPWTMTPIGMGFVFVVALLAMAAIANWSPNDRAISADAPGPIDASVAASAAPAMPSTQARVVSAPSSIPRAVAPMPAAVASCNRYAASRVGQRANTAGVVARDAATGSDTQVSAAVDGGPVALHGLDEGRRGDERYRRAYASCMRSRGYTD